MTSYRTTQQERQERAAREAAEWLQLMRGAPSAEDRAALMAWAQASPEHLRELLLAGMLERELAQPGMLDGFDIDAVIARAKTETNVVAMPGRAAAPQAFKKQRFRGWKIALAACLVLALGAVGWQQWLQAAPGTLYATTLGEQRSIQLEDGSVVMLSPSTRIDVAFSAGARDIYLRAGAADFQVAHDKTRPFRVHAGASIVQAVGTRFSVNRLPSGTVVEVTEGVVKLSASRVSALDDGLDAWLATWQPAQVDTIQRPGRSLLEVGEARNLVAGESAHIAKNGQAMALDKLSQNRMPAAASAGRAQADDNVAVRLLFRDDTLADIVAEFNRFNAVQIEVQGNEARMQRYSGVFDARDSASFLEFIRCCSSLSVARQGEKMVVRQAERTETVQR